MIKEDREILLVIARILLNPGSSMLSDHKKILEYYNKGKALEKGLKHPKKIKKEVDD